MFRSLAGALVLFSAGKAIRYSNQFDDRLPYFIEDNSERAYPVKQRNRILSALVVNKKSFTFASDNLTLNVLKKIVANTNGSVMHYSGNCAILAACLLFNLKFGRNILAGKNIYPVNEGAPKPTLDKIIFGTSLEKSSTFDFKKIWKRLCLKYSIVVMSVFSG